MKPLVLAMLAAVTLASVTAKAAKGIVVSRDGQVVSGRIVELVNGDHVTIELASGARVAIAWNDVFTVKLEDEAPPAPVPAPAPPVVPTYAAAPIVGTPRDQAPPPAADPSKDAFAARPEIAFSGGLVGLDGDLLKANGNTFSARSMVGEGAALRADVGVRFSRPWTFYGSYEYDSFGKGGDAGAADLAPIGHAVGIGFKAMTNPRGPLAAFFDIGAGWRWLRFPTTTNNSAVAGGPEPLRVAAGGSIVFHPRLRLDAAVGLAVGQLTRFALPQSVGCVNPNTSDCDTIPDANRTWYTARTFTVGAVFTL